MNYSLIRNYVEEALTCLRVGALRAAVVFLWVGAIAQVRVAMFAVGGTNCTVALRRHDSKTRDITGVEDLARVRESALVLAAEDLKLFDKNEKDILVNHCLDLRNKCGHPGKYRPGPKKVSGFVEDLVSIIFEKL